MAEPDEAVIDILVAAGVATKGSTGFMGPMREVGAGVPAKCIFAAESGGPPAEEFFGSVTDRIRRRRVQVMIRGNPDTSSGAWADGVAFARSAWSALQRATPPSGYKSVKVSEGAPVFLFRDDFERPRWVLNVELLSGGDSS